MKYLLSIFTCLLWSFTGLFSQQSTIDNLRQELNEVTSDTARIDRAIDLAILLQGSNPDSAHLLCSWARTMANRIPWPKPKAMGLRKVGLGYRQIQQLDTSLLLFEQGLKLSEEIDYLDGKAFILNSMGSLYYSKDEPALAQQCFEQAYELHREREDKDEQTATLNNIAIIHMGQGAFAEAIPLYQQAIKLQEEIGNLPYLASFQTNLALCYRRMNDLEQANAAFQDARITFKKAGDITREALILALQGGIYRTQGNYIRALATNQEALALRKELGNKKLIANSLINFGKIYNEIGDYAMSNTYFQSAHDTLRVLEDRLGQATLLNNIGENLKLQERYPEALSSLYASLALRRELGPERSMPPPLLNIGEVHEKMNRLDSAEIYLQESLQFSTKIKDTYNEMLALTTLGRVYQKKQQIPAAIATLEGAYSLSADDTYRKQKLDISKELYRIYKGQNNLSKALFYHERFKLFQDSLFNEENTKAITRLESENEFKQEKQVLEHKQEKEMLQIDGQLRRQRSFQFIMGIALAISLILIAVIARYYRLKRQANEKLQALNAETLQQKEQLQELNQVKSRFFTNISHELRTPLTVISGMVQEITGNEKAKELITRNSSTLLNLVNQILELRKLETGTLQLSLIQGDVISYLRYIFESFHSLAENRTIKMHFLSNENEFLMDYDKEKLLRIISNLLSNAIKFTPAGQNIYLIIDSSKMPTSLEVDSPTATNSLLIQIKDTGIGIPEANRPYIFDRFYQIDESHTRRGEGTGIGLALTKELIKLMKGSITVESEVGKGSTFTIMLPATREATLESTNGIDEIAPSSSPIPTIGTSFDNSLISPSSEIQNTIEATGALTAAGDLSAPTSPPTLLIIEDNPDVVTYLESLLSDRYELEIARNGEEGIELAIEQIPDLILSDVMMPKKDGFEVCEHLKTDERTSHIPIVLLTAKADVDSKLRGLQLGADAYLAKPFNPEELFIRLEKLNALRLQLQERYHSPDVPDDLPAIDGLEPASVRTLTQTEDAFIRKLRNIVEDNIDDENFDIQKVCRAIAMSRTQLHRKIKSVTNQSTSNYIRAIRLYKAKTLLDEGNLNISQVALEVGFNERTYFARAFKKEFGISPHQYIKTQTRS